MTRQAALETHPFETFGPAPYRVVKVREAIHVAGDHIQAAGSCDVCLASLRWVYTVRAGNGVEFSTGCDCAQKCGMTARELRAAKRSYTRERASAERRAERDARERSERTENRGLTRKEIFQAQALGRDAARQWLERERKGEAVHAGTVGQRIKGLELRVDHVAVWEGYYGVTSLYIMRDRAGNAYTWKTSGGLATQRKDGTWLRPTEPGEFKGEPRKSAWFLCDATVKDHTVYKGLRQTALTRVRVRSMGQLAPVLETRFLRAS